ncbi:DUF4160 domain-containing protein [Nostoc sp.]|uniref:DUF4160 domain-containing protein n=1 Tax=Nostoc sp. TaxID=1180 RepID=UPI002FF872A4
MPTILKKGGFEVRIYLNDRIPAHVHVFKGGGEAKINIGDENLWLEQVILISFAFRLVHE